MRTHFLLSAALSIILCLTSTAQTLPAYLPSNGLVGWWPFNGNANDESGNGNDGLVNGATLTEDRLGNASQAYYFDGTNSAIAMPFYTSQLLQQYSISLWFNIDVYTSNYPQILWGYNNQGSPNGYSFNLQLNTASQLLEYYMEFQPNVTGPLLNSAPNLISTDSNYHLLINKTETSTNLYINNILINSNVEINPTILSDSIYVGNNGDYLGFNGVVDDIAIYNRALTTEEINALYTGEPVTPPTACNPLPANLQNGLVGYWPFCGNANDESGNGNDGTVNGASSTEDRFGVSGSAYSFDGVDDYIDASNSNHCNINDSITISYWVNVTDWTLNTGYLQANIIEEASDHNFHNQFGPLGNELQFSFQFKNRVYNAYFPLNQTNLIGDWNNVTLSISNQGEFNIYLNGIASDSLTSYPYGNSSCEGKLILGREVNPIGEFFFNGLLDDIGIWNRALTPDEVQQLYTLNACTFTIYDTVTVTETIYDTVSVSLSTTDTLIINTLITAVQPAQENTFLVYPNPANTQITINNGNFAILGGYSMRITNSAGQEVYNQNITQPEVTLNLNTWGGNGLYILYINDPSNNTIAVKQIVLQ